MSPWGTKIMVAPPASTLQGLAVKARVLGEAFAEAWDMDDPQDLDWSMYCVRAVVEDACALAGVDRFGRRVEA
jgi:hypothetical protein